MAAQAIATCFIHFFSGYVKRKVFVLLSLIFIVSGSFGVQKDSASMSVMEGDSVTLNTDSLITKNKQDRFIWYFNDIRIVQIVGDERKICTDVHCEERFRDRLKLNHVTGSLTITNINTTDSGDYQLKIINSGGSSSEKIFSVSVRGVPVAGLDKVKTKSVKEGESVTFDPGVMKDPNDVMTWHYKDILIAEITGDQSQICTDDQCKERFIDRLKMDNQTGSLTITNTRTSDSGDYQVLITTTSRSSIGRQRRSISITNVKSFSVSVIGSGLSSAAVAGIVVVVLLVFAAVTAAVIYYHHRSHTAVPQNDSAL